MAALVTDMRDIASLARESELPVPATLDVLLGRGLTAVAVGELTGQELMEGVLDLGFGSVGNLPGPRPEGLYPDSAALLLRAGSPFPARSGLSSLKSIPVAGS